MQFGFTAVAAAATMEGTKRGRAPRLTVKRAGFRPEEINQPELVIVGIWLDPDEARRSTLCVIRKFASSGYPRVRVRLRIREAFVKNWHTGAEIVVAWIMWRNDVGSPFCSKGNVGRLTYLEQYIYLEFNHRKTDILGISSSIYIVETRRRQVPQYLLRGY